MQEEVFRFTVEDSDVIASVGNIEKGLLDADKAADLLAASLKEVFSQSEEAVGDFVKELDALPKQYAEIKKQSETLKNALKNATDPRFVELYTAALSELDKEMGEVERSSKAAGIALEQNKKSSQGFFGALKQGILDVRVFGKSLDEWRESIKQSAGASDLAGGATTKMGRAWSLFNNILKASIIGAIIGLLIGLINHVSKLQPVLDFASKAIGVFNAAIKVTFDRISLLGEAFGKLFSGDFSGAWDTAGQAVSGFADEVIRAGNAAAELEGRTQKLRDAQIKNSVELAKQAAQLENLKKIAEDETKGAGERIGAINKIREVNKKYTSDLVSEANSRIQIAKDEIAIYGDNAERQTKLAQERIALIGIEKEATDRQQENEKKLREIRKQAEEERIRQLEEYQKAFADIQKQSESLNIENTFNPVERVVKQYQQAITETEALRARLLTIAPGDAERAKVNEAIETLFDELAIKYREELNAAEDELNELKGGKLREALNPLPPPETITEDLKFRARTTLAVLSDAADQFIENQEPRSLLDILGISEDSFDELKDATKEALGFLNDLADSRVKEADAAVQAAERKVQAAEEALEKEQKLALDGNASDLKLRQDQLAAAKAAEEEAQKERAKAVRTQILLDSAQQVSSLITATANIFKGFSSLPIVGQILAVASIGAMFAAFGAAKAQALKAAQVPKFRKGVKLDGRSHEEGGLAISDQYGNVVGEAEGKEWLIGTKPSKEHDRFLERLNEGEFAGVNLDRMFRPSASNPITEAAPRIERIEREFKEIRETQHTAALASAYREAARDIVRAIEEKEVVTPLTNYRVTKKRGRNTFTNVVREEK